MPDPTAPHHARRLGASLAAVALGSAMWCHALPSQAGPAASAPSKHVLILSVDGLHASDLAWYVAQHPTSSLAQLETGGTTYTNARTTFPSDSFPGTLAQVTGAQPGTAGVYYDDTWNRTLLAPGTTDCAHATPGAEAAWTETIDKAESPIVLDSGANLPSTAIRTLPTNTKDQTLAARAELTAGILELTGNPADLIDTKLLPVDPKTCSPVLPHEYLRVNTVFDVAKKAGLRTAWSDKHAAYEILQGPTGHAIDDEFTPQIDGVADSAGDTWTSDNRLTQEYDSFKVAAVLNEIKGHDHSGRTTVGEPAIFGMNFQSVSTAQKLPTSNGLAGGYAADGTPGPVLRDALGFVDAQVGRMVAQIKASGHAQDTTVVLSAKHGQSPVDSSTLRRVDDGALVDAINAGWKARHPGAADLVTFDVADSVLLMWLSDRSTEALQYVRNTLWSTTSPANLVTDPKGTHSATVAHAGLASISVGAEADKVLGAPVDDTHAPDVLGIVQPGVVYTGGVKKIAEHGGASADDLHVALVTWGAGVRSGEVVSQQVSTTSIAPTTLSLLGLNPNKLDGVRIDGTPVLPGLATKRSGAPAGDGETGRTPKVSSSNAADRRGLPHTGA